MTLFYLLESHQHPMDLPQNLANPHCVSKHHLVHSVCPSSKKLCFCSCIIILKYKCIQIPKFRTWKIREKKNQCYGEPVGLFLPTSQISTPQPSPHVLFSICTFHAQSKESSRMQLYRALARNAIWENEDL